MTKDERLRNYRELFKEHVGFELLKDIRESFNKGLAPGDGRFASDIEALTKMRVTARKPRRQRKLEEEN